VPNRKENVMKKMRSLRAAILAAAVLSGGVEAWAMNADALLAVLKRVGVTDNVDTSKKPCLCSGGGGDQAAGVLVAYYDGFSFTYKYDCSVPVFDAQGNTLGGGGCIAAGGSFIPLSK
jgi:hypothetical protein